MGKLLRLYRAFVPRVVRDVIGRLRVGHAWSEGVVDWRYHRYSPARWDREYRAEKWRYLGGLPELARYSVIVGYVQHLAARGEVLDLGCGEGILRARLGDVRCARYVGVDISAAAIAAASCREDEQTRFVCADVASFEPDGLFDVIVLNEVLYYLSDPLGVLRHYERFLKHEGVFVISMFVTDETRANWRVLDACYDFIDRTVTANGTFAWDCRIARRRELP